MSAAATLLAIGQIGNAFGLRERGTGAQHLLHRLWLSMVQGGPVNIKALGVTVTTLVLAWLARKLVTRYRLPRLDMLAVLIIVALAAYGAGWTIPTGSGSVAIAVAGTVPAALPTGHIPTIKLGWLGQLAPDATAIAFLGLLEALAIAKAIAVHTGQSLDFNRQCLAEGIANLVGGFFRCLPGSGSLSRSALNYQSGGATRFVGIISAAAVALAVIVLAPLARFVPKAALAALLLLTATRLIEPKRLLYTMRASRQDATVLVATIVTALAFGLDMAILVGVALSILLYVTRAANLKSVELLVDHGGVVRARLPADSPAGDFVIYDLEGELFFGAAPHLDRCLGLITRRIAVERLRYVVLRLKRVRNPDAVCLERLEHFLKDCSQRNVIVLLAGLQPDLLAAARRLGFFTWFPPDRAYPQGKDEDSATLAAIRAIYRELRNASTNIPEPGRATASDTRPLYYLL
jgi:SulP family sulfate permease